MNLRKITVALVFIILGTISVSVFWRHSFFLSLILLALSLCKHKISPIKHGLMWFFIVGFLGPLSEILIIIGGAWFYAQPHFWGIPFWLPFLWGLTGMIFITLYEGIKM